MKCLLLLLIFVFCNGKSTAKYLCKKWDCLNEKLHLADLSKEQYGEVLRSNLPSDWQNAVDAVLETCFDGKSRKYAVCTGQSLMLCVLDNLNKNCPAEYWNKDDACSNISSPGDLNYVIFQRRYCDFEKNLLIEKRPESFMRTYFNNKCCDLPPVFNTTLMDCGFQELMHYYISGLVIDPMKKHLVQRPIELTTDAETTTEEFVQSPRVSKSATIKLPRTENLNGTTTEENVDPLDCCDMENFIQASWRSECGFSLKWDDDSRFTVVNVSEPVTTTTEAQKSLKRSDIQIVPVSCEEQNCVFSKLNIISSGVVDKTAFAKLLDNVTNVRPEWTKAKGRVVTKCLNKPLIGYDTGCEINDILSCTFDILTENCPHANKNDTCKHSTSVTEGVICQISTSKYRPRHRRQFCNLPELIRPEVLAECRVNSIYKVDYVPEPAVKTTTWIDTLKCKKLTESSTCLLNKMDVLNKYGFIDRFKMNDRIRNYIRDFERISTYERLYKNALEYTTLYTDYCSSSAKLLNLIDIMFMSCPQSKYKNNEKCSNLLTKANRQVHIGLETSLTTQFVREDLKGHRRSAPVAKSTYKTKTMYNFGILGADEAPPVKVIDVKPTESILVLQPVYERMKKDPLAINSLHNDGIFRS